MEEIEKKKFIHNGIEYEVAQRTIDKLNSIGVKFTNEYIDYLLQNNSPHYAFSLGSLATIDIPNKELIGPNRSLGRVIKIDKQGQILATFDSIFDAALDALNCSNKYSFERLHTIEYVPQEYELDFFGVKMKVSKKSPDFDYTVIDELNRTIKRCKNKYLGRQKIFKEMYTESIASKMTYDEYVVQGIRWEAFICGQCIQHCKIPQEEHPYTKHVIENCSDYEKRMTDLFQKYSVNETSAFERIDDLNNVKGCTGIYLLCFPQIKGCYVGKTEKCLATRITQHFTKPNSEFDKKYQPSDVKEIFIMQLGETTEFINLIEEDCIATLGKDICLNALAGGTSIEFIKSDTYHAEEHFLPQNLTKLVTEDSLGISKYRKDCRNDMLD